jgi:hypothetical protein
VGQTATVDTAHAHKVAGDVKTATFSFNVSKVSSNAAVSESASNAAVGSEGSVLFTAKDSPMNGEPVPAGDIVTIHGASASCFATTNGSTAIVAFGSTNQTVTLRVNGHKDARAVDRGAFPNQVLHDPIRRPLVEQKSSIAQG